MNRKVLIASDSTTDLEPAVLEKYGIKTLPLGVTLDDKSYLDGVDINPDFIYQYYNEHHVLPKTSAINISVFTDFFRKYTSEGYSIVFFSISSEFSSSFRNSEIAAEAFPEVYCVDTRNLSTGGGLLVLAAADMAKAGLSAAEIAEKCRALTPYVDASFVIDNLEYLHKGGRCSGVAVFGANLLKIKPCVAVRNGKMEVVKKYRGSFGEVMKQYVRDRIGDASDIGLDRIFVTNAGLNPEYCKACADLVRELAPFKEVIEGRAGCTISSHCGRDCFGVLFIRKHPVE